jgi:hypothetical protein
VWSDFELAGLTHSGPDAPSRSHYPSRPHSGQGGPPSNLRNRTFPFPFSDSTSKVWGSRGEAGLARLSALCFDTVDRQDTSGPLRARTFRCRRCTFPRLSRHPFLVKQAATRAHAD